MRYRYTAGDSRDYFVLGRVDPGDERDFPDIEGPPDDGCWVQLSAPLAADPGPIPTPPQED